MTRSSDLPQLDKIPDFVNSGSIKPAAKPAAKTFDLRAFRVGAMGIGAALAVFPCIWYGDTEFSETLARLHLPGDLKKAIQISEVFAHGTGAVAILVTLWWIDLERRGAIVFASGMTLVSGLVANALKLIFSRVRPHSAISLDGTESWLPMFHGSFWDATQRSFPSGHAATAVALATGLSIAYPRGKYLFATFAMLACLQRILHQAHYLSDVLAGTAIALICYAICLSIPRLHSTL